MKEPFLPSSFLFTSRGQIVLMLLGSLCELQGGRTLGGRSRQEVIRHIEQAAWFAFQPEDRTPFSTAQEPRWTTVFSFARTYCVNEHTPPLMVKGPSDHWQATADGINEFVLWKQKFQEGLEDVRKCYLWTPAFKMLLVPEYIPSNTDQQRPLYMYEDQLPEGRWSVKGTKNPMIEIMRKEAARVDAILGT